MFTLWFFPLLTCVLGVKKIKYDFNLKTKTNIENSPTTMQESPQMGRKINTKGCNHNLLDSEKHFFTCWHCV